MPDKSKHPTIIVGGMHRSGTSLVTSLLGALSVRLGDNLLSGDSHNQPGYFEDLDFLRFHQQVLAQSSIVSEPGHSDWGWTESESLDIGKFEEFRDQAQQLLSARIDQEGPWGWKDPRTTLFLDFWDSLVEDARYVFVYRFPWDVADSMQRLGAEVFLSNPEYAYKIWAFYNSRLRDFYIKHSDRCVLVSINALKENLDQFVSLLNRKLGLATREADLERVFKDHLFRTTGSSDPLINLVATALPDCTKLLSELDEVADISGAGLWQPGPVKSRLSRPDATGDAPIDLSVVTPCYEQGILLLEAIASLERHAPPHCELIIVNDGSRQPQTLEILNLLKLHGYFVIEQENAGLSAARNIAISLARGRYILPLDDDNRIRDGFLGEAIQILDSSPEVGVVYGDRFDFGLRIEVKKIPEFDLNILLEANYIDACAVFRKQVWLDCHGYDPLMCPADDWDLWISAATRGWRFHHHPHVAFDYRVRPNSLINQIKPVEVEDLLKRVRVKHSELYWAKAMEEVAALKHLLAEQADQRTSLDRKFEALESQVGTLSSENATLASQLVAKDEQVQALLAGLDQTVSTEEHQQPTRERDEEIV